MKKSIFSSVSFIDILRVAAAFYIVAYFSAPLFHAPKPEVEFKSNTEKELIYQGGELPEVVVYAQKPPMVKES